jgi:hypothetical protein
MQIYLATTSNVKSAVRSLPSCWNCPHALYRPGFGKFARNETMVLLASLHHHELLQQDEHEGTLDHPRQL